MDETTPSLKKTKEQPAPIDHSSIPWPPPPRSRTMLAGGGAAAGEPGGGATASRPGGRVPNVAVKGSLGGCAAAGGLRGGTTTSGPDGRVRRGTAEGGLGDGRTRRVDQNLTFLIVGRMNDQRPWLHRARRNKSVLLLT